MPAKVLATSQPIVMSERRLISELFQFYEWRDRVGLEQFVMKLAKGEIKLESLQTPGEGNGS